jgi:predicted dehydrogenase
MQKYNVAIVGCGRIGYGVEGDSIFGYDLLNTHATAYNANARTDIIAVCDIDMEKAIQASIRFGVDYVFSDCNSMLEKACPDVLSICTHNSSHVEIVKAACNAGVRFIFCEKPIADTVLDARTIVLMSNYHNVPVVINHSRRFDIWHQQVYKRIQEGNFGTIEQVLCSYNRGATNMGSHLFDLLIYFFGDPLWVHGSYSNVPSYDTRDPNIDGMLQFPNDVMVHLYPQSSCVWKVDILGSNSFEQLTPRPTTSKPYMVAAIDHIVSCLDGTEEPISVAEEASKALEISVALHISSCHEGRRVRLPLDSSLSLSLYAR